MVSITPLTKKRELHSDFDASMPRHPVNNDLSRITNEEAIKASIKNIVLTNRGERFFDPNFGCDIRAMLFENVTSSVLAVIRQDIIKTIEAYEPRCRLIGVDVIGNLESNSVGVFIQFIAINSETPTNLEILVERVR